MTISDSNLYIYIYLYISICVTSLRVAIIPSRGASRTKILYMTSGQFLVLMVLASPLTSSNGIRLGRRHFFYCTTKQQHHSGVQMMFFSARSFVYFKFYQHIAHLNTMKNENYHQQVTLQTLVSILVCSLISVFHLQRTGAMQCNELNWVESAVVISPNKALMFAMGRQILIN